MKEFVPSNKGPAVIRSMSSNTISDNYRDSITIAYQYIGSSEPEISFRIGGKEFGTPIMAGPIGGISKANEAGIMGYAKAVAEAGSVFWTGFHEKKEWQEILAAGLPGIRVIKPLKDLKRIEEEVRYDTQHGAVGYAMDIDHGLTVYGKEDGQEEAFAPKTVQDLKEINEMSALPFFLKGIMSVHDAVCAAEAGCAGIVISGHNNRFPCAVPPLKILPAIREAVGKDMTILVDGGMNTGYEVFKAVALGADGVLVAKGLLGAYAKGGPDGLTDKILEMTAELKGAMANTGSADLQHINRDCIIM